MLIEREGARLSFTTVGSGADVVLLHPTPTHHEFWLPITERLQSRFRLTLMDLRGHGRSTPGSGPITMARLAEDLNAVLAAAGIARAAFVGCSIGGYLLYEYWRRFPQQMSTIAVVCGKPQPDTPANREKRQEWMQSASQPGGLENFFDLMADTLVGPTARRRDPQIRAAARAMMNPMSLNAMLAVQQGLASRPDSVPTLPGITVPVCAIAGGEDQSSTPPEMRVIAERAPRAEFHLLPDAGHYAPLEQPDAVGSLLSDFLARSIGQAGNLGSGKSH